jgi:iron-sulfur cluster assembly protein
MEIIVSDHAITQLLDSGVGGNQFLRLGVQQGGCAGMSYSATLDDSSTQQDAVIFNQRGVTILSEKKHLPLIDGLEIDFSDDLVQPGFILKNPNSAKSCGCGSSFKAREEDTITPCGGNC